ncbi:MAG: hypothetical protein II038_09735 [Lachnospiraceae bacterium]|nr:hypothetical protein [Lachnospiraceae bacterium]
MRILGVGKENPDIKITGTKCYVDIQYEGKTARFWGDLCVNGFSAIASTMEWILPEGETKVSEEDRSSLIVAIRRHQRWKRFKIIFVDDHGKPIPKRSHRIIR